MSERPFILIALLAVGSACSTTGEVGVGFQAAVTTPVVAKPAVAITEATMLVRDLMLDDLESNVDRDLRIWAPVDLLDPGSSPLNLVDVEPGKYQRVRFRIRGLDGFEPGPENRKVSSFITGTIDGTPFEYRDDTPDEIELRSEVGILVVPGDIAQIMVQFDVDQWFAAVDLSGLGGSDDGVIYIDGKHNLAAQTAIRKQITASISLVE